MEPVTRDEILGLAGLTAATGIGVIVGALTGGDGSSPLKPGEEMGAPSCITLDVPEVIPIRLGDLFTVAAPVVTYKGPGRDTFTTFAVLQEQRGQMVTVYSSGVAGIHIGPSTVLKSYQLVAADQPQPDGAPRPILTAYPYPGPFEMVEGKRMIRNPICGAPAQLGKATAAITIYERERPEDADGFSSPTCNRRKYIKMRAWTNHIVFV